MPGRAATQDLILWCRALRHGLDIGLSPVRVFRQQERSGPSALRATAGRLADRMEVGESFADALRPEGARFPRLFREMVTVGEVAGRLPTIFEELETYFEAMRATRKEFYKIIAWPALQYFAAILVITILLFVLGAIGSGIDPIGLGLTGASGAVLFFVGMMLVTGAVVGGVVWLSRTEELRAKAEALSLGVPAVGGCFRAFALHRFCLAFSMTLEAGLRADQSLRQSLRATANHAYAAQADRAAKAARRGQDVPGIINDLGPNLFPSEFQQAVQVGEESGRTVEVMRKQASYYAEEARRKFQLLGRIAAGLVYAGVGVLLIVMIFKIFMTAYIGPLNQATRWADHPDEFLRAK